MSRLLFPNIIKQALALAVTLSVPAFAHGRSNISVSFRGQDHDIIRITPEKSTGIDELMVAYDSSAIREMVVTDGSYTAFSIERYSNLGGGYAEPVTVRYDGTDAIVDNPQGDMGYIIKAGETTRYIWLVNYLPHRLQVSALTPPERQDCDNTVLNVEGNGNAILYYTIDGRPEELSREIEVTYNTLEWNDDRDEFVHIETGKQLPHLSSTIMVSPPIYCNSRFHLTGDRFLRHWGMPIDMESPEIIADAVAVHTSAEQTNEPDFGPATGGNSSGNDSNDEGNADDEDEGNEDGEEGDKEPEKNASNIISGGTEGLGGSAPAVIAFSATDTDAVIHNEWQIAQDENFEYILYRFNDKDVEHTFEEEGTLYARFVGSNADGSCQAFGETYTITIGSSELRIPNAFSPNDDGVNDIWKVGYRSLLDFKCWIFDRYGNQIYYFTDPNSGWDGTYRGKKVDPGVYYYVIEATGADDKKYKKGGDINIIRYTRSSAATGGNPSVGN